jgi:hypothetical protein
VGIFLTTPVGPSYPLAIGTAFNTFTTRQDVSPRGAGIGELPTIQGGVLNMGSKLVIDASGEFSTTATPTLALGFYIGTIAGAITTVIAESSAITTGSGAASWPWHLEWTGLVVGTGTAGSIVGSGFLDLGTSLTAVTRSPIPITLALRTIVWDTTIARSIGVCATYGASSVSNAVKTYDLRVQLVNGP